MDSDHYSAFALHFRDDSFEVRKGEDRYDDAILWLSFRPIEGSLNMAVYDGAAKRYSHEFSSTRPQDVAGFIAQVEADFGVKVPRHFRKLSEEFLIHAAGSFGVSEDVRLEAYDCEYCGYDYGSIEAFYFPPLKPGDPASIGVSDSYGCYDSLQVFGDPADPDVLKEALSILDGGIRFGDDAAAVELVKNFRAQLLDTEGVADLTPEDSEEEEVDA